MSQSNLHLDYRRNHNGHDAFKSYIIKSLVVLLIVMSLITLASVGGMAFMGSQSKLVPYVVEVDKLGHTAAVKDVVARIPIDNRVVRMSLAEFISDTRGVSTDWDVERKGLERAYAKLRENSPAFRKLNEYFGNFGTVPENAPQARALKGSVNVDVVSAIPQSDNTWQVDWDETHRDIAGVVLETARWRALMSVQVVPPTSKTTEEKFVANPFGIFVKDFSWNKELKPQ